MKKDGGGKFEGIWIPYEIASKKDLNPIEKMILAYFYSLNKSCTELFTSNHTLAEYLGTTFVTISNSIKRLEEKEYLKRDVPMNGGKRYITIKESLTVVVDEPLKNHEETIKEDLKGPLKNLEGGIKESLTDNKEDNKEYKKENKKESLDSFLKIRFDFLENYGIDKQDINPQKFENQIKAFEHNFNNKALSEYQYFHDKSDRIKKDYLRERFSETDFVSDNIYEYIVQLKEIKKQDISRFVR